MAKTNKSIGEYKKWHKEFEFPVQPSTYWFQYVSEKDKKPKKYDLRLPAEMYKKAKFLSDEFDEEIFLTLTQSFFNKLRSIDVSKTEVPSFVNHHFKKIDKSESQIFLNYIQYFMGKLAINLAPGSVKQDSLSNWIGRHKIKPKGKPYRLAGNEMEISTIQEQEEKYLTKKDKGKSPSAFEKLFGDFPGSKDFDFILNLLVKKEVVYFKNNKYFWKTDESGNYNYPNIKALAWVLQKNGYTHTYVNGIKLARSFQEFFNIPGSKLDSLRKSFSSDFHTNDIPAAAVKFAFIPSKDSQ
jgi:hypothetical protein